MANVGSMKSQLLCPSCQSDQVKEIAYGFPNIATFDFERFEVGGCCVAPDDPRYKCSICQISW
jgi:transposase-like protein